MNPLLILLSRSLPFSVVSGSVFTSSPLRNYHKRCISRRRRHRYPHSHFRSVSGVETRAQHLKLLKTQASMVFGIRFLRLASAPEWTQNRRRSQQWPRRLHSLHGNPSGITTTATCYSSRRIGRTKSSRRAFAFARSSKTRRIFWRCAGVLTTEGRVSSSLGSAPTRPKKFDALTSSLMASTTVHFVKVCSLYLVAWTLKIRTGNIFVCSYNLELNPSPHSRHALTTYRRAPTPTPTDLQLDLAVDHLISGLRDQSSRDYLRRKCARCCISWQEAVQMAQASKVPRAAEYTFPAAATFTEAMCA